MDQKLVRIRELINEKEAIDTELASLIGASDSPKRGRPRKGEASNGAAADSGSAGEEASSAADQ